VLGLGLATLVSVGGIAIALQFSHAKNKGEVATTTGSDGSAVSSGGSAIAGSDDGRARTQVDAAEVTPHDADVDAPSAKPSNGTDELPPGWSTPGKTPDTTGTDEPDVLSDAEICKRGCAYAKSTCRNATTTCVQDCLDTPKLRACLQPPLGSCNKIATCGMKAVCGDRVLRGSGSCADAITCQTKTCQNGDIVCGCQCATNMSPTHANALVALDNCAINCRFEPQCLQAYCQVAVNACLSQ